MTWFFLVWRNDSIATMRSKSAELIDVGLDHRRDRGLSHTDRPQVER
jgi:hypothetical protein